MSDTINTQNSSMIAQRISDNMGISDLTPNNKISILVNGLLNEHVIGKTYTTTTLDNFFIQTASEKYLEMAGVAENLPRIREQYLRINSYDNIVSIKQVNKDESSSYTLEQGAVLELVENECWLVINQDVDLSSANSTDIPLSCDIKGSETSLNFVEGTYYPIVINDITYYITFNTAVSIPLFTEDLETYRSRLIYAKNTPRYGSSSSVRLALASILFITNFYITQEENPTVYLFNSSLLEDDADLDLIKNIGLPLAETLINKVKGEGIQYEVQLPKKINISLSLRKLNNNSSSVPLSWYNIKDNINSNYVFGNKLKIDRDTLIEYFTSMDEDLTFLDDYELVLYKNFLGESYESSVKVINISEVEYPFINEVKVE